MYQNYIFDLYGTLVDIETDEYADEFWKKVSRWCEKHHAVYAPAELKESYSIQIAAEEQRLSKEKNLPQKEVEIQLENVWKAIFGEKNMTLSEDEMQEFYLFFRKESTKYIRLFEGANELLVRLHKAGRRVYLLSNAQRIFTEPEMRKLRIYEFFDGILYSSDAGVKKPSKLFYEKLFLQYKLEKTESVMIGNDCIADIAGAHEYGLSSMYIHTKQSTPLTNPLPIDCTRIAQIGDVL